MNPNTSAPPLFNTLLYIPFTSSFPHSSTIIISTFGIAEDELLRPTALVLVLEEDNVVPAVVLLLIKLIAAFPCPLFDVDVLSELPVTVVCVPLIVEVESLFFSYDHQKFIFIAFRDFFALLFTIFSEDKFLFSS